jgi:hypothetical protein
MTSAACRTFRAARDRLRTGLPKRNHTLKLTSQVSLLSPKFTREVLQVVASFGDGTLDSPTDDRDELQDLLKLSSFCTVEWG